MVISRCNSAAVRYFCSRSGCSASRFIYYGKGTRNEYRITNFGRGFPFLRPEYTGALFVFTKCDVEDYQAFVLNSEEDIDQFLDAFGISPTETNQLIDAGQIQGETQERIAIQEFIAGLTVDFPLSEEMSAAARDIQNRVYDHLEFIRTNPDRKIIDWTNTEYALFRAIEHARYGDAIARGFTSVDEFITMANMVLNRRKSRAGKSLEHHLSAIFDGNEIIYTAQAVTEGNKKPDFIFPSQASYHDMTFPTDKLISLAAKTTCKDRWRQVINEADRLRDRPKYLCTLQQGISPAQMDEMQSENVILVVPRQYITSYPADRQDRICLLYTSQSLRPSRRKASSTTFRVPRLHRKNPQSLRWMWAEDYAQEPPANKLLATILCSRRTKV